MARDLRDVFACALAGDLAAMERAVQKLSKSSQRRAAAREMGLVLSIVAGHSQARDELRNTTASEGNIALAHWNIAEAYIAGDHGLKRDLGEARKHLELSASHVLGMNGGKIFVSNARKRHQRIRGTAELYDEIFGTEFSRYERPRR